MKHNLQIVRIWMVLLFGAIIGCSEDTLGEDVFGTLTGKVVTKEDNVPIPNVKITTNPVSNTVFTDEEGFFTIRDVLVGEYSVQAELKGFETAFEAANVLEQRISNVIFEMDSVTAANKAAKTPILLSPEDEATGIDTRVEFSWNSSKNDDDEILYTLELRNGETNEVQTFSKLKDTTLVVEELAIGKNYFWQVIAADEVNDPVPSEISSFTVQGISNNRFLFVREMNGNNVIFSGGDPNDYEGENNANVIQLTNSGQNSYRPIFNQTVKRIAFLRSVGGETHLFSMEPDGTDARQLSSTIPVSGFRQERLEFAWHSNGARLFYPHFNKLYSIGNDGSGLIKVLELPQDRFITEIATNPSNDLVALLTTNANGYAARIIIVDPISGTEEQVVLEGVSGAVGGLDYSADGNRVLYSYDVNGAENENYRQFDVRLFEYDLNALTATEIDTKNPAGINSLDPKYSPDEGSILFVSTSNDGVSRRDVYRLEFGTTNNERVLLFTNGSMPDWE